MKVTDIKKQELFASAPSVGTMLVYTRKTISLCDYSSIDEAVQILDEKEVEGLLELHLFDSKKEFRVLASESKAHDGLVSYIASFVEDETVYRESVKVEKEFEAVTRKIVVLNHLGVKDGLACVDDYRLMKGE